MSKQEIEKILQDVLRGLSSDEIEEHDWYVSLYPKDINPINEEYEETHEEGRYSYENSVAIKAIQYPQLHDLMVQIVERITCIAGQDNIEQLWENDEEQAGGAFARELALYDKKYIPLYLKYIKTNDLDHEVYQLNDMLDIFEKWNGEALIIPLLIYRGEHGQHSVMYEEIANGIEWREENKEEYLKETIQCFKEEYMFDYIEDGEDDEDLNELDRFLTPIFQMILGLDDDEMRLFSLEFNNQLAQEKIPTLKSLIKRNRKTNGKISAEDRKTYAKAVKNNDLTKVKKLIKKGVQADIVVAKQSVYAKALSIQKWYISVLKDGESPKQRKEQKQQMEIIKYLSSKITSAHIPNQETTYTNDLFMGEHENQSELINAMIDSGYPVTDDECIAQYMGLYDVEATKKIIAIRGKDNGESLTSAARFGNLEVLEYLLSIGIPVNTPYEYSTGTKVYAIHSAILLFPGNKDIIVKLLDAGADVTLQGMYGNALETTKGVEPKIDDEIVALIKKAVEKRKSSSIELCNM
ncbi:MAG: hypothetical protein ACK5LC_03890 [Coprobacillaceae bacterium]